MLWPEARFTWTYLAVVIAAGAIPLWSWFVADGWTFWITCLYGWTLLSLAIIDLRFFILPDLLTFPLLLAGLVLAGFTGISTFAAALAGAAAGFLAFYLVRAGYAALRGREGLGFGDVKMLAALGAWLGWQGLPSAVLIACLSGLCVVLVALVRTRRADAEQKIAYGACLAAGGWIVWLYGPLVAP